MARLGLVLGLVVVLAACQTARTLAPPPPDATLLDLRGTWAGTWGGTPVTLVVVEQQDDGGYAGIYVGPAQVLGLRRPAISGVLTTTGSRGTRSVAVRGSLGASAGRPAVVLVADGPDGQQRLVLTRLNPAELGGTGESDFTWGPGGVVRLTRSAD
ncbi:MAG: hypothetical protein HY216_09215 [Candidatus Rokubacteria bacterium]|nr:hypothetical protein [Candidatus Rokubacteria bacterium]